MGSVAEVVGYLYIANSYLSADDISSALLAFKSVYDEVYAPPQFDYLVRGFHCNDKK